MHSPQSLGNIPISNAEFSQFQKLIYQIAGINLCFGAWLYGETYASPHAIEVGEITLERAP